MRYLFQLVGALAIISSVLLLTAHAQSSPDLTDEFDDTTSLEEWSRFYEVEGWPDMMDELRIEQGYLVMEPWTAGWYADYHAPFLFKEVTGDFDVQTRLLVSGKNTASPQATWSLTGLMVREPRTVTPETWSPGGENWLFLTTGIADDLNQPVFETKTTVNSRSRLELHPNRLDWVELQIVRKASVFTLLYRYEGEEWTQIEEFDRPDLGATLQVGLNAYTDYYSAPPELMRDLKAYNTTVFKDGSPDLRVRVDYVRFSE